MSNEFRNRLSALVELADQLRSDVKKPLGNEQKVNLDHITTVAHQLLGLVTQVLDMSRI